MTTSSKLTRPERRTNGFCKQYPNDDFADDAQVLLDNLGKKDEEIIDNLTKKSKSGTE